MEVYGYQKPGKPKKRIKQNAQASHRHKYHEHTKQRLQERYGLEINTKKHDELVNIINNGQAKFLCKFTNSRSCYEIPYQGQQIIGVYSSSNHRLVTVLPNKERIAIHIFLANAL